MHSEWVRIRQGLGPPGKGSKCKSKLRRLQSPRAPYSEREERSHGRRSLTKTGRKQDLGAGLAAVKMRMSEQYRPRSAPECLGARAADGVASSAGAEGGRASPALGQRANATSLRLFQLLTPSADRARPTHAGAGSLVSLLRPCEGSANAETLARPEITGSPVSIWASARQAAARGACLAGGG